MELLAKVRALVTPQVNSKGMRPGKESERLP